MAAAAELAAMQRAVALASDAVGRTNPNPAVGAVVLDATGRVVGDGHTKPVGGDHAEVVALRAAGERARGGILVVTLEPCRHTGRTGPCTAAIIAAGISRVVYAVADPHLPAVGGAAELARHGVAVEAGLLADEAAAPIERWLVAVRRARPHLTWKYAATLDGRTAASDGTSRWITGEAARVDVHRERAQVDAVIVGVGTVLADDPELTVRDWPTERQPLRVVVDSAARTPVTARLLDDAAATLIAVGREAANARVAGLAAAGAEIVRLPTVNRLVDLAELLTALYQRDVRIALVEGGATIAASFLADGLIDRILGYYAPTLLGAGQPLLGEIGVATMAGAQRLQLDEVSRIGNDVRVIARVRDDSSEGQPT